MKVFVLESVENLTESWHSGGGATVIAEDLAAAKVLLPQATEPEWAAATVYTLSRGKVEPKAYIFPDAGCC